MRCNIKRPLQARLAFLGTNYQSALRHVMPLLLVATLCFLSASTSVVAQEAVTKPAAEAAAADDGEQKEEPSSEATSAEEPAAGEPEPEQSEGEQSEGEQSEGEQSEGEQTEGEQTEEDAEALAELRADVLEWVDQLDAPSLSKRKLAEKRLIESGSDALQFLPEKLTDVSIEASERLARVRAALQLSRTKTQSSAITVRLDKATTLGEALEAISRDSGVEFEHQANESMKVEPVATALSFWHAVDLVLDQTDLDVNFYGGDRGVLALTPRAEGRPSRVDSAAYAGVYRIEATSVNSRRVLNAPEQSAMNISMEIAWEPRMTPIGLSIPVADLAGTLDGDAAVEPQESGEMINIGTNADVAFGEFYLPMELPAGHPEKIKSLSGTIRALLPGKTQKFKLALGKVGEKQKVDAMTVYIEEVRKNGPLHEVRFAIELEDPDKSLESHRGWIFENPLHIDRKDGTRADHLGYEVYRQTASEIRIGYLFDIGGDFAEDMLIYESATAVANNEVDFVIQDIPLP